MTTALLLNWKRPENLKKVIKSLRMQSADIQIYLWNNNAEDKADYGVDVQINSSRNFFCWPRWLVGSLARTEFIFTLDDDLALVDPEFIDQCIDFCKRQDALDIILGITGVVFNEEKEYWDSTHIIRSDGKRSVDVDVVKGRFMFMRREFLSRVTLSHNLDRTLDVGEDIYISSHSKYKIIPDFSFGAWENLPENNEALDRQPGHNRVRQKAVDMYFKGRS